MRICSAPDCDRLPHRRSEWCKRHYDRVRKFGSIHLPSDEDRFWDKVNKDGPICPWLETRCWNWLAYCDKNGYGIFKVNGKAVGAHRYSYLLVYGDIPVDRVLDHICHNETCVNWDHLRAVTHKQNIENHSGSANSDNIYSKVRGVTLERGTGKWMARVRHNGKLIHVGRFVLLEDAEAAVQAKRNELFTHNIQDRQRIEP